MHEHKPDNYTIFMIINFVIDFRIEFTFSSIKSNYFETFFVSADFIDKGATKF